MKVKNDKGLFLGQNKGAAKQAENLLVFIAPLEISILDFDQ